MNTFVKWQKQDAPAKNHILALVLGALIFPTLIPIILVVLLPRLDRSTGIPSFFGGWPNILAGILMVILGSALALWTIYIQIALASGTPFPMLPTKKLLIVGPFQYCRNPMTLGTVMAYLGAAVWVGSYTSVVFVLLFAAALIVYLKLIEEKELRLRFGEEYAEYKKNTPFIIPLKFGKSEAKKE